MEIDEFIEVELTKIDEFKIYQGHTCWAVYLGKFRDLFIFIEFW